MPVHLVIRPYCCTFAFTCYGRLDAVDVAVEFLRCRYSLF